MKVKKVRKAVLIISFIITFIIVYYLFRTVTMTMIGNGLALEATSFLVGFAGAYNVSKIIKSSYKKQEKEENQKKIRYIAQTKNCEFCFSELNVERKSEELIDELMKKEYLVKELYKCPKCHYAVSNNTLYKNNAKKKVYKYCEIIDYGNLTAEQVKKGTLYNALYVLDIIDNDKCSKWYQIKDTIDY